uniref:Uncharacterized protein n=1 Tax=Anopheles melas TaxID=34690 RepID=A0A182UIH0_9DIPT
MVFDADECSGAGDAGCILSRHILQRPVRQIQLQLHTVRRALRIRPERYGHDAPFWLTVQVERRTTTTTTTCTTDTAVPVLLQQQMLMLLQQQLTPGRCVDFAQHTRKQPPPRQPHTVRHEQHVARAHVQHRERILERFRHIVRQVKEAHVASFGKPGRRWPAGRSPSTLIPPTARCRCRHRVKYVERWIRQLRCDHEHAHAGYECRHAADRLQQIVIEVVKVTEHERDAFAQVAVGVLHPLPGTHRPAAVLRQRRL